MVNCNLTAFQIASLYFKNNPAFKIVVKNTADNFNFEFCFKTRLSIATSYFIAKSRF